MKISNKVLIESVDVIKKLGNMDLNIKASYTVAKNIKLIQSELEVYDEERVKLLNKYAIKDEEGNIKHDENGMITIDNEFVESWNNDFNELSKLENEIDIKLINEEDLFKCDCNITPMELMKIGYMIA